MPTLDFKEYERLYERLYEQLTGLMERAVMFPNGFYDALKKISPDPVAIQMVQTIDKTFKKAQKDAKFKGVDKKTHKFGEFDDMKKKFDGVDYAGGGVATVKILKPDGGHKSQEIKIGKLVNDMVSGFSSTDIEKFARALNITIKTGKGEVNLGTIKVVKGHDITNYYLHTNYASKKGELSKSCMRYKKCQMYVDFYEHFPDKIQLVVKIDDAGKLLARAVLWKLDSGLYYMDRIYQTTAGDKDDMLIWAKNNKIRQSFDKSNVDSKWRVSLPNSAEMLQVPWMDTFNFGYVDDKKFVLCPDFDDVPIQSVCYHLQVQDGWGIKLWKGADGEEYDADGFDENGFDENGFDVEGFDEDGFNADGFNYDGFDEDGYDEDGYNEDGFNKKGFNEDGYDQDGFDANGYDEDSLDRDGEEEE